jgi:hypothetical protein
MTRPRIKRIAITGFRGFGSVQQIAEPAETVSVFWGGNSNGKTSFGEAIEFLLTGQIARRELLAGAKDEFADSLRNAHVDDKTVVAVDIVFADASGTAHAVRRELKDDYQRGSAAGCVSVLTIDGEPAAEGDLQSVLGLTLFPAPLQAPVLSQHSLGFLFSSSPTDRATYFRAVLDTQDLEDFRQAVSVLDQSLEKPVGKEIDDFAELQKTPAFADAAKRLLKCKDKAAAEKVLSGELGRVLEEAGLVPEPGLSARAGQLVAELNRRRDLVFPIQLLARKAFVPAVDQGETVRLAIEKLAQEAALCDAEAVRLIGLFETALKIPHLGEHLPEDCPLCGSAAALTAERVAWIKGQTQATAAYQLARKTLTELLGRLSTLNDSSRQSAHGALPLLAQRSPSERRAAGFTRSSLKALGIDDQLVADWIADYRTLLRSGRKSRVAFAAVNSELKQAIDQFDTWSRQADLLSALHILALAQADLLSAVASHEGPASRLNEALTTIIDQSSAVAGWEALANRGADPEGAVAAARLLATFADQQKAVAKALTDIDKAIGTVQDAKFATLSDAIRTWWDRLRPDEVTFFDAVQRRGAKTRRMIDMRAGLSLKDDKSDPKFRDAVAVFSQSQLHCLGLAIFLARASSEGVGFIVLDDLVLTSDDDYRPNFASTVIEGLLAEGIQTIIATQDHATAKDIETRWAHRNVARFNIVRNDPLLGSEIRNEDDQLAAMIARAQPFCNSEDPEQRKLGGTRVREAIERFCKLLLVKDRVGKGDALASITDYDGKNFGNFSNDVKALLIQDASHPGKLQAAHNYVTPGTHDDTPPPKAQLKVALGDLRRLKADYLG